MGNLAWQLSKKISIRCTVIKRGHITYPLIYKPDVDDERFSSNHLRQISNFLRPMIILKQELT